MIFIHSVNKGQISFSCMWVLGFLKTNCKRDILYTLHTLSTFVEHRNKCWKSHQSQVTLRPWRIKKEHMSLTTVWNMLGKASHNLGPGPWETVDFILRTQFFHLRDYSYQFQVCYMLIPWSIWDTLCLPYAILLDWFPGNKFVCMDHQVL